MDGMVHANDVRIAESLRGIELPADPTLAMSTWNRTLNDAVVRWHRDAGCDMPDLNELDAQGLNEPFFHCFPHYFVLPMYSSASSYRFRPLGPEETLMEIWSLTRFPEGKRAGEAHAARAVGVRRSAVAADPRAGLLEPAEAAEGPAREGLRVHAPERAARGTHLELPADHRRLPRRPSLTSGCSRRCGRSTCIRSTSRCSTSASDERRDDVRRGRRGHPRHDRRVHPGARRRPDRRRRRHLLSRRRLRDPGHGYAYVGQRPNCREAVLRMEAAAGPASPRPQHARHRLERPRGIRDQRRGLPPAGRLRLGDPARRPIPRHPPPRRRHVAIPPTDGDVRSS